MTEDRGESFFLIFEGNANFQNSKINNKFDNGKLGLSGMFQTLYTICSSFLPFLPDNAARPKRSDSLYALQ